MRMIGVDVGGTFTDLVYVATASLARHREPAAYHLTVERKGIGPPLPCSQSKSQT